MNLLFDFSRSKKDKTSDKRDASEEKKNAETDVSATDGTDSVRKFHSYLTCFYLSIFEYKESRL